MASTSKATSSKSSIGKKGAVKKTITKKDSPKANTQKKPSLSSGKPLTKNQIITEISTLNNISKKEAAEFIESFIQLAFRETKKNSKFVIPGLGILKLVKRQARMGRNPLTGETIKIAAKTVVKMTISKTCKDAILGVSTK